VLGGPLFTPSCVEDAGRRRAGGRRGSKAGAQTAGTPTLLMDGHVHVTNRVYWEKADLWQPRDAGWDYARARASGVNCIIDNLGTYGAWNYNYTPKQALRLIETAHRYAQQHADKMAIVTSVADARRVIASGRMAVFLGSESGWDHEGDIDVLNAFYRLGLRTIQFASQSGFNAFADSATAMLQGGQKPDYYHGLNDRGRALVAEMNRLGILIDITHGTEATQKQLIEASRAPVVASHDTIKAVSGVGLSDEILKSLAARGASSASTAARRWSASAIANGWPQIARRSPRPPNRCPTWWATGPASHARRATMANTSSALTRSLVRRGALAVPGRRFRS
jgi:microsomal dipeptidase-like Zn-dependent dipeptidase